MNHTQSKVMIESNRIEFKERLTKELDIEKEVVAFLNYREGGILYIGIDKNGKTIGVEDIDGDMLKIKDRIRNNIAPSPMGLFEVSTEKIEGVDVIRVFVASGSEKPYYKTSFGMSTKGCYVRVGTAAEPMPQTMIDDLYARRTRRSLRNVVSPRYADHTFQQLKIYYEERGFTINDSFLQNLDLYNSDGKLNMVAYLMADNNSMSVRYAKYAGTDKCDLLETQDFGYCSLLKAMDKLWDKIDVENRTLARITGQLRREENRLIEYVPLREAFINAFVHNDYTTEQAPLVEIYSDRLSITSYGGLLPELSEEEFFAGRSIPRNRELMRIFYDMDWVEQLGSGMNRILRTYSKDIFTISEHFMEVTFRFADAVQNVAVKDKGNASPQLTERQRDILKYIQEKKREDVAVNVAVNTQQIADKFKVDRRTIQRDLKVLISRNLIYWSGSAKNGHWEIVR